jgi:hypothetical protein
MNIRSATSTILSSEPPPMRVEAPAGEPSPGKRYGITIVANDKIADWLLPFLESYRATNAATPLYLIPYDDNLAITRRAASAYGVKIVEDEPTEIDRLAADLYPLFPGHRRRLRKLQALSLPLDEVIYVDVDVILFRDLRPLFGALKPGKADFIIASPSFDYVYNNKRDQYPYLKSARLFNDGFFVASNKILNLQNFIDTIREDAKTFHAVRKRGMLFAQPLVNFVVHRRGLQVAMINECVPNASHESFYKAEGVSFRDGAPIDARGAEIYFAHWAGAVSLPSKRAFDATWRDYSQRAWARIGR